VNVRPAIFRAIQVEIKGISDEICPDVHCAAGNRDTFAQGQSPLITNIPSRTNISLNGT
jgi:hypothetical protein